jgi:hypothetical protein
MVVGAVLFCGGPMLISEPCVQVAAPLDGLAQKVRAFVTVARLKAENGLTVAEFGELFLALMRVAIEAADTLSAAGSQKKELVLDALTLLFDEVADKVVPIYLWPIWVVARPAVRAALIAAASGGIEVVLQLIRKAS